MKKFEKLTSLFEKEELLYCEGEKIRMNTTLIIMATRIGSRFGEGIKQLAQMGPNGEIISKRFILGWIFNPSKSCHNDC